MATIEVDGKTLEVEDGKMLIEATDAADIYIPRFCYHEKLSVAANCRMCLVEVEKAPKPLPACATPVMDGMVVKTRSDYAREAQKGTMEFLLINHPLDCPVCDQGGECPLQDQAMGYGKDDSRYEENKRVVPNPNIGPLIATEMTRCIHCTRCVRFGEEVAGVMEMGAPGRGEYTRISTFLGNTIDSEVSGNMIDLCPVGALTSKPFRFSARSWELNNFASISPHDCVGANLKVQSLRNEVERVLPIENEDVNECWLADRDRYSYEACNGSARLTRPMIKDASGWQEVPWQTALQHAVAGLKTVIDSGRASDIGAIAAPSCSMEEFFLTQKLVRGLGSDNVDHRLTQTDFRDDDIAPLFPGLEMPIAGLDKIEAALLIGSNLRKEQPLLSVRLRRAVIHNNATVGAINVMQYPQNYTLADHTVVHPDNFVGALVGVARAIADGKGAVLPAELVELNAEVHCEATARALVEAGEKGVILVGANAMSHADGSTLRSIAAWIAKQTGARLGVMPDGNGSAGWLAGCIPHRGPNGTERESGMSAGEMLNQGRRGFLLVGSDPELDAIDGKAARSALDGAEFVVQMSAFQSEAAMRYADVLLPMTPFTESAGTFVNCEGRIQRASVAAPPKDEARPGWKVLRVMANFLEVDGFNYVTADDVIAELALGEMENSQQPAEWRIAINPPSNTQELVRIVDMPMYRGQAMLRHAPALQTTADNPAPAAWVHPDTLASLGMSHGEMVSVADESSSAPLPLNMDARVPAGCVYIPAGWSETAAIGSNTRVTISAAEVAA